MLFLCTHTFQHFSGIFADLNKAQVFNNVYRLKSFPLLIWPGCRWLKEKLVHANNTSTSCVMHIAILFYGGVLVVLTSRETGLTSQGSRVTGHEQN